MKEVFRYSLHGVNTMRVCMIAGDMDVTFELLKE